MAQGYTVMSDERIGQLNQYALDHSDGDEITYEGIEAAEQHFDLTRVWPEDDEHAQVIVMQAPDGAVVNCWLEGIEVGFDDQLDWYDETYPWPGETIIRAELVGYDERTDIIRPSGDVIGGAELEQTIDDDGLDWSIVEPVKGWGYSYLIRVVNESRGWRFYYLADLDEDALNRTATLAPIRVTVAEKMEMERRARREGLTLSEYVRQRALA